LRIATNKIVYIGLGHDKEMSHGFMVRGGMILGEIIGEIVATFAPINVELPLAYSVANPMVTHIKSF